MIELNVSVDIDFNGPTTPRTKELIRLFGLRQERIRKNRLKHTCQLKVSEGEIVYITGASGSGKTVLLNAFYEQVPAAERLRLDRIAFDNDKAVIDCIEQPLLKAIKTLAQASLSDVFFMLQTPANLSAGQQHRYLMAQAFAHPAKFIFIDEFTSSLDRITAAAAAFHLHKFAKRSKKIFMLAGCHEDVLADLKPDILIVNSSNGKHQFHYKDKKRDLEKSYKIVGNK